MLRVVVFILMINLLKFSVCEKKTLLIGGMFPMSGGWAGGVGCKPAAELALKDVNHRHDLLQDYELKVVDVDSKCQPGLSLRLMYDLLYDNDTKIMMLTGCSGVSTFVAQAARMWNLIVLSYGSSSPALSDNTRFPTFFRTHPSATLHNPTRLKLFKKFKWSRIATLQQMEEVFTSTIKNLEEVIKLDSGKGEEVEPVEISIRQSFQTDPSPAVRSLKKQDARIIVGVFYEDMARRVFCEAYKEGLYGERYVWLIIGWYPDLWYAKEDDNIDCTPQQLRVALEGHLTTEVLQFNLEKDKVTDTGITTRAFEERLREALEDVAEDDESATSISGLAGYVEAPLAYDAIWALGFALNNSIEKLRMENKSLESFDYHDSLIKDTVLNSLNRTDFEGVSGRVTFTSTGDRIAKTQIEQMQNGTYYTVGYYDYTTGELDWLETDQWPGGSYPADRTIIKEKFRVLSRYILYAMLPLSYLGIIFSIASLVFNICTAKYSIIYNSLPSLNSCMAVGCTLCLACVTLFGMDGEWVNPVSYSAICLARTWTLTIGFTLSYGAMFVKVLYSWRICRATKLSQSVPSKTISQLIIPVTEPYYILLSLLVIDIAILSAWQSLDPLKRSIKTFDAQLPTDPADGDIKYRPLLEHCSCDHMTKWIAVIYSYKGLLLLAGLFLAYETRNVKIRFINDLKFVAMAIYNILVLCVVSVPVTLIIPYQHNALYGFISVAIILSCYLSLSLIFIPKMIPIIRRRIDLDQHETQQVLIHQENEKRLDELKERNDTLKQQIAQKEKEIRELHLVLQKKFSSQISNDDRQTSDSAFSEEHTDRAQESPECRMADTELL